MSELTARGVVVRRAQSGRSAPVTALDCIDFTVEPGELVVVMGGTGAGKSTLALALAGLVTLDSGTVSGAAAGEVRLVLQRPESTFLTERVLDEVALAALWRGVPAAAAQRRAVDAITQLALPAGTHERDPLALSGGEQRRVAIAAVLADDPRLTILDEPGAGLDAHARHELHVAIERLHVAGRTIVLVTHDPAEAALLATRLVVLEQGRVAWDGPVAPVLGDPARAAAIGIDVAPEVRVLHAVARSRGIEIVDVPARPADAIAQLARVLLGEPSIAAPAHAAHAAHATHAPASGTARADTPVHVRDAIDCADEPRRTITREPLPALVDARVRTIACALAVAAALLAQTLLAAALITVTAALVVAAARIDRARVRLAVQPLVALTVLLIALQLLVGGDAQTRVTRDIDSPQPAFAALLRALQASAVVLVTLALSAATATTDLAAAIRRLLAPLRVVRVPVDTIAFVVATGLGLVPAFADELDRLRLAQRARGIGARGRGPVARIRSDARLLAPLFVAAFRRAHLLADALAVRGYDPRSTHRSWRPRSTPASDVALLAVGIVLLVVSRFA